MLEYAYIFTLGLFFGSFFNVLADRLSKEETIGGRSHCDHCKHVLEWYDLIPIVSFTSLKGKCRYCRAPIAPGHVYSELITGVTFVLTWYFSHQFYGTFPLHIMHIVIAGILIVMLLSDIRYQIIPDEMQIALFVAGLWRFFFLTVNINLPLFPQIWNIEYLLLVGQLLAGGIIVGIPLLLVFLVTKGKGMGFGDVKLTFNMGIVSGLWNGLYALYIAFIVGGIVGGIILLMKKGGLKSKIAFGPFLILGTYIMLFYWYEVAELLKKVYHF